jgi:DNA (cytosine-5)-methyltransferase 1
MTHLDLCTGIGGFHLAAEWAGFETIGFSEVDPFCCQLLAEKWPEIKNYGDLRRADFSDLRGRITVLSAGVPCQPSSLAGKRRGAGDDRWLWPAVLDVVESVEPAWCIFENPPGIATFREFNGVLLRLAGLGYEIRLFSVPANAVGAKHRRQRVFIVADRTCEPALAITDCEGLEKHVASQASDQQQALIRSRRSDRFRLTEPPLCGRADGVSDRSHRLKALGNAVVPQQVYPFFEAIAQTMLIP